MLDKNYEIALTRENEREVLGILQELGYRWVSGSLPLDFKPFDNDLCNDTSVLYIKSEGVFGLNLLVGISKRYPSITISELRKYANIGKNIIKKFSEADGMKVGNFVIKADDSFIDVILNVKYGKPKNIFRVSSRPNTCNRNSLKDLENFGFKIEMERDKVTNKTFKILTAFLAEDREYMYSVSETRGIKYIKVFMEGECTYNTVLLDPKDSIIRERGRLETLLKESEAC